MIFDIDSNQSDLCDQNFDAGCAPQLADDHPLPYHYFLDESATTMMGDKISPSPSSTSQTSTSPVNEDPLSRQPVIAVLQRDFERWRHLENEVVKLRQQMGATDVFEAKAKQLEKQMAEKQKSFDFENKILREEVLELQAHISQLHDDLSQEKLLTSTLRVSLKSVEQQAELLSHDLESLANDALANSLVAPSPNKETSANSGGNNSEYDCGSKKRSFVESTTSSFQFFGTPKTVKIYQAGLHEARRRCAQLEKMVLDQRTSFEKRLSELETKLADQMMVNKIFAEKVVNLEMSEKTLKNQLTSEKIQNQELSNSLESLRALAKELENALGYEKSNNLVLSNKVASLEQSAKDANAKVASQAQQIDHFRLKLEKSSKHRNASTTSLSNNNNAKELNQRQAEQIAALDREKAQLAADFTSLQAEKDKLSLELDHLRGSVTSLLNQLASLSKLERESRMKAQKAEAALNELEQRLQNTEETSLAEKLRFEEKFNKTSRELEQKLEELAEADRQLALVKSEKAEIDEKWSKIRVLFDGV